MGRLVGTSSGAAGGKLPRASDHGAVQGCDRLSSRAPSPPSWAASTAARRKRSWRQVPRASPGRTEEGLASRRGRNRRARTSRPVRRGGRVAPRPPRPPLETRPAAKPGTRRRLGDSDFAARRVSPASAAARLFMNTIGWLSQRKPDRPAEKADVLHHADRHAAEQHRVDVAARHSGFIFGTGVYSGGGGGKNVACVQRCAHRRARRSGRVLYFVTWKKTPETAASSRRRSSPA